MPIEYTNQPLRLSITAKLEMEDGQEFNFDKRCTDFTEDGDTVASYFETISEEVYDKLEEFSIETDDEEDFDDDELIDDWIDDWTN